MKSLFLLISLLAVFNASAFQSSIDIHRDAQIKINNLLKINTRKQRTAARNELRNDLRRLRYDRVDILNCGQLVYQSELDRSLDVPECLNEL